MLPPRVIFASDQLWHVGHVGSDGIRIHTIATHPSTTPELIADGVARVLNSTDRDQFPIVLAIPTSWCMCATVKAGRTTTRQTLEFDLKEKLPLAAEHMLADFIVDGDRAFGVCTQMQRISPVVVALEQRGMKVESICPTAVMALQHLLAQSIEVDAVLWSEQDQLNLFLVRKKRLYGWYWLPLEAAEVITRLNMVALNQVKPPIRLMPLRVEHDVLRQLGSSSDVELVEPSGKVPNLLDAAMSAASARKPVVDLLRSEPDSPRRLQQIRRPIEVVLAALVLFFVSLIGSFLWSSHRLDTQTQVVQCEQTHIFHEVIPKPQGVPNDVARSLRSEYRRRTGTREVVVRPRSALLLLLDIFAHLPEDEQFRLTRLKVESRRFELDGHAWSPDSAERIFEELRCDSVLHVNPPRMKAFQNDVVKFQLTGSLASSSAIEGRSFVAQSGKR